MQFLGMPFLSFSFRDLLKLSPVRSLRELSFILMRISPLLLFFLGLRVQFAASLVPGGHVAWWEGVIVSIQEEELAQGTPFGLPISHFAVPPFPSGEKKRGKPPGLVGLSSSGSQNQKKNRLQTQHQDGEGTSHRNSSTRHPSASTASCPSKASHHRSHSGTVAASEGEGEGDGGSGEKVGGDSQQSDAETGWVEIVYRVAPGETKVRREGAAGSIESWL